MLEISPREEHVQEMCDICHSKLGQTAQNMIGPVLNGLKGRKSGSVPGFSYSDANKNSGIVWDEGTFKEYIKDPKAKIPATKMVFPGIKNEKEIDDLWSFISIKLSATVRVACYAGRRETVNNQPVRESSEERRPNHRMTSCSGC